MSTWCSPTLEPFTTFVGVPQQQSIWNYPQQYASHPPQKLDQGPLVGPKQSSSALTTEYAAADPVYVQKTTSLPNKYSHYRTVRGDGNCGWRAGAFCYFETLLTLGDQKKTLEELDRLQAANSILTGAGFVDEVFLDFAQASFDLLKKIAGATGGPERDAIVHNFFNEIGDDADPNAVIAHFKFLTSAWMKTNPAKYADFVESGDVAEYCKNFIEPFGTEIDHIGVMALTAAFLIPAGLALEVLYLDRSPGSEVNTHRFEAYDDNGQPVNSSSPTISLLYRPGHYDILYRLDNTNPVAAPSAAAATAASA